MKILVVDDDTVARKVLGAFLKQSNYEIQVVEDGPSALRVLTGPEAPPIALIDWMMPGLSGPELCTKLRAHPFTLHPYLIILSGRKEKSDIAQALDSGADDFISKPFNIQETQARLRVAQRAVERQQALCARVAELEISLKKSASAPPIAAEASVTSPPGADAENALPRLAALEKDQFETVIAGALRHIGHYAAPRRLKRAAVGARRVAAWAGLLLTKESLWIDLLLEIDDDNLSVLLEESHGKRAARTSQVADFCVRFQTALRDSMHSVLRAMGSEVFAPLPAQAVTGFDASCPDIPEAFTERHHYRLGTASAAIAVVVQPAAIREITSGQLQLLDVLAKPYPPADLQRVPLIRGGVALTDRLVEKLRGFTEATAKEPPPIVVHRPSALALHYCAQAGDRSAAAA